MRVTKLLFMPTGQYHDQVRRSFQIHTDGGLQHQLNYVTEGGRKINPTVLGGLAGQILRPASTSHVVTQVPNGWGEKRVLFLMELHHDSVMGPPEIQAVSGYSDYPGYSSTGAIDPNMRMYLNHTISTRTVIQNTHFGKVEQTRLNKAYHVLTGAPFSHLSQYQSGAPKSMRPSDVVDTIGLLNAEFDGFNQQHQQYAALNDTGYHEERVNLGSTFGAPGQAGAHLKLSDLNHGLPSRYVSNVLRSHKAVMESSDTGYDMDATDFAGNVSGLLQDNAPFMDRFIKQLLVQGTSYNESDYFTYGELCRLCPEAATDAVTKIIASREVVEAAIDHRQYTEDFYTPSQEIVTATIIANALPAILTELMTTQVSFVVSNQYIDGQPQIHVQSCTGFTKMDMSGYMEAFKGRFMAEVWRDISRFNAIDMTVTVNFQLIGQSTFDIKWMDGQPKRFVIPTFMDAQFAPVISPEASHLETLAREFDTLTQTISMDLSPGAYASPTQSVII